jgi:hypothetical protein
MAFSAKRPEVGFIVVPTELKGDAVIELAVIQIDHTTTHTAMTSVTLIDATLQAHPCATTDAPLFAVNRFKTAGINHL